MQRVKDAVIKGIKEYIQAVKELYLSKQLIPEPGRIMIFRKGGKISEWFDPRDGIPKEAFDIFFWSKPVEPKFFLGKGKSYLYA